MSDEIIIKHCSPTLAGLKTGNMFTCYFRNKKEMNDSIRRWNQLFVRKGIRIIPLRFQNSRGLIYIYRPARLNRDLQHDTAYKILQERGYGMKTPDRCVIHLMKRINESDEFPHEVGLFLGYPPEDVSGFIENKAESCKCVGCWKVYGDAEAAKKLFAKYKKCTDVYRTLLANGSSIERLTVAG